ncbi:MAG: hypothetical protein MUO88_09680 [Desulfobacterales bacterium]|nr:hypothetical protein [Desulfobacterales bacterium]
MIYYLSTQGKISLPEGVRIVLVDPKANNKPVGKRGGELADFIYHNIRCAQAHDAEIDYEHIDFGRHFGIGRQKFTGDGGDLTPGVFIISNATILALILAVICAPELGDIKLPDDIVLYNKVVLDKKELVGNKNYLMGKQRNCLRKANKSIERDICYAALHRCPSCSALSFKVPCMKRMSN